jgi:S-formylglutathione hydrolase FrmB
VAKRGITRLVKRLALAAGVHAALGCVFFVGAFSAVSCAGELQHKSVTSAALKRDMSYTVYVPDGYQSSDLHYPVLYLLHGAGGDEHAWAEHGGIRERADRLIASGAIPPTLIVMPGCRSCWWIDGAKDQAETAFWNDLVPSIAGSYRTIDSKAGRLVAGLSAGGYGSIRFAMKYPDRIAAVAALSPAVYSVTPPTNSSARNQTQSPFLGLDGQFDQAAWTARNYPVLADGYFGQRARVPVYLMSGDRDGFGIAYETALLFKLLFDKQPDIAKLRIIDGDHSWPVWAAALDEAMTYIYRHAARPERRLKDVARLEKR